ncbi:unnamed protein product [Cylindrotheca closterium]|uniref:BspA family leucine-rich repeat surface protein n=2 Tax=Cylindrotheca closterium TaxID=2856 RepID=A0AAD2G3F8_9STRA|nr:unnamed protein product [Cylindrotheca closterium]
MVEAVAAQDIEDELNAARQRGRQEAMSEVARTDIAVAVAHDDDDNSRKGIDEAEARKRKKKFIVLFALFLIAIGVTTTMLLLFGRKQDAPAQLKNTEDSNAKVVVVYIPPTKEECEAIANGTFLGDQQSLIQKSFDIRIDITLGSENDFGPLFSAMLNHIQEKLIPIMAGCGAIDFFDTTMAITDELKNATNSIVNGKVEKESEKQCDGSNGNCRSYVLVLDLYLKEEQSSVSLMEVIGSAMNGDKLVNALGDFYPVETASVPWIIPSNSSIVVTSAPSVLGLETGVPTQLSDSSTAPILSIAPTFAPTFEMPLTYGGTNIPTNKVVTIRPTIVPDLPSTPSDSGPNSPSNAPIRVSTQTPTRMGTHRPTSVPSQSPTRRPTLQPTRDTAFAPTRNPTKGPSMAPVALPTPVVSKSPTDEPSSITSLSPTAEPTLKLSSQPTPVPSTSDISPSPSIQPSMSPTHYLCFQNNTELTNTVDDWFASAQLKASVEARYGLIGDWCFGEGVTSMDSLFLDRTDFNEAIGSWDISSVREIPRMFWGASSFNQDLSSWDVSLVRNMFRVFEDAISFNQDISPWDVSSAKSMSRMFVNTTSFNQDLSSWDVSSVFSMTRMFDGAVSFNQDLSSWDVPSVTKMDKMFHRASSFNQNLCPWGSSLRSSADVSDAFLYTNCPSTLQVNLTSNTKGPFCHVC